jgi:integrase
MSEEREMRTGKLNALKVNKVKVPGYYGDGGGLFLQVSRYGSKSWVFRFKTGGRLREMGLGSLDTYGLAEARERARECRKLRDEGKDPIEERRTARDRAKLGAARTMTFRECADRYITAHEASWKNPKHAAQWPATLAEYVYPSFGSLPVQAIDTALVMKAIEPIWNEKPETASRVRGRTEAILDYATARGFRTGENPARWRGHLDKLLPKKTKVRRVEHHAALPFAEMGGFLAELRQQRGIGAKALEFAILTAVRTGEAIGAPWDEFDLAERTWTIPPERMKTDKEHRVPLSDVALAILEDLGKVRRGNFVFSGNRAGQPLSNMAMTMTLRRMGRGELTVHGFRSSFRDWAAERTGFPAEVAEMALAHAVPDAVERAYRRGDLFQKRRQLMDAWAKFCRTAPAAGAKGGVVRSGEVELVARRIGVAT